MLAESSEAETHEHVSELTLQLFSMFVNARLSPDKARVIMLAVLQRRSDVVSALAALFRVPDSRYDIFSKQSTSVQMLVNDSLLVTEAYVNRYFGDTVTTKATAHPLTLAQVEEAIEHAVDNFFSESLQLEQDGLVFENNEDGDIVTEHARYSEGVAGPEGVRSVTPMGVELSGLARAFTNSADPQSYWEYGAYATRYPHFIQDQVQLVHTHPSKKDLDSISAIRRRIGHLDSASSNAADPLSSRRRERTSANSPYVLEKEDHAIGSHIAADARTLPARQTRVDADVAVASNEIPLALAIAVIAALGLAFLRWTALWRGLSN